MRTYLVTGGAGFIGSNYIHYMFRKYDNEIRIINVDALTYAGNLENLKDIENRDNYTFIKADITDKDAIMKIFEENDIDRVVHFAAESHVDRSIKNPEVFVKTNVLGTAVMLNCAKAAWELPDGVILAICWKPRLSRAPVLLVRRCHAVLRMSPEMTPQRISVVVGTMMLFT